MPDFKPPRHAVAAWPDADDCEMTRCAGTKRRPGCGEAFGLVARNPETGRLSGRDVCPHCGAPRGIPAELHATYLKWFGLVEQFAQKAAARGWDYDDARTVAVDAYHTALLRWLPSVAKFSTFAVHHLRRVMSRLPREAAPHASCNGATAPRDGRDAVDDADEAACNGEKVAGLLKRLNPQQRAVVAGKHGIGRDAVDFAAIGREMGVSRERVRQVYEAAMVKLRKLTGADELCQGI